MRTATAHAARLVAALALLLPACASLPEGIEPVRGFELERYLGTWYEIARYDHRYERGLERVRATYSRGEGDAIRVVNRGFDPERSEWREAEGRARPVGAPDLAHLEVSFFGPFYASYVVFALDPEYRWAWVTGSTRDSLWLLSREPEMGEARFAELLEIAVRHGFDASRLQRVPQ